MIQHNFYKGLGHKTCTEKCSCCRERGKWIVKKVIQYNALRSLFSFIFLPIRWWNILIFTNLSYFEKIIFDKKAVVIIWKSFNFSSYQQILQICLILWETWKSWIWKVKEKHATIAYSLKVLSKWIVHSFTKCKVEL